MSLDTSKSTPCFLSTEGQEHTSEQTDRFAPFLAQLQAQNRQLNRSLARETQNPAYNCVLPDAGLRLLNAARVHADPPGEPVGVLP